VNRSLFRVVFIMFREVLLNEIATATLTLRKWVCREDKHVQ